MKIIADVNIPYVEECFSSIGDVVLSPGRGINAALVADADVLLVRSITKVNEELLKGGKVKFVATATIGFEHIDRAYLSANDIGFGYAPGANANSVAEYVVAALLVLAKKYKFQLEGKSIGIIGAGNVGGRVAKKAKSMGMEVLLNDPPLKRQTRDEKYLPLAKLYGCDFVTLHTPMTFEGIDKTFHLADERFFGSLKRGAFFINTARGAVMDTSALKSAMGAGKLAGVVLDVWEDEPNIDGELLRKVDLSTPHIAGYSLDGKVAGMIMIYRAVCEYFGIKAEYSAADFLPAPETTQITIDDVSSDEQSILHDTVQRIYVINRDDFNMREILLVPAGQQGGFFDDLRKNYPPRREFQNTQVVLTGENNRLRDKLGGIGFKV